MSLEKKFVHVSFRIPSEAKAGLERDAKKRDINLNALVSQILVKYVTFDRIADQVEAVYLNKLLFVGMLDKIEEVEMERLGRNLGPRLIKKTFAFLNLEFDIDGLIVHYFRPLSTYSRWYDFDVAGSGANRKLMFEHPYGLKWSAFLKQYLGGIIKSATGNDPRITTDEELVTIFC